jgi:protein SCO1/2
VTRFLKTAGLGFAVVLFALLAYLAYANFAGTAQNAGVVGGPFALVDQNGRTVTDKDFRDRWLIVYFGYTHCPDACPTALNTIGATLDQLGPKRARVTPLFVTIDPSRDTATVLKSYVASFGPEFVGLTGSEGAIAAVEQAYHVYAAKRPTPDGGYDMDHSSVLYVMDPQGRFVTNFAEDTDAATLANRLKSLIP